MSPARSELNATRCPSGDQAPRLSSRVVAMTSCGGPVGWPLAGETGSFQMSAFWPRIENAMRRPSAEIVRLTSWPAPEVICWGRPAGPPFALTGMRQRFMPPLRNEEK